MDINPLRGTQDAFFQLFCYVYECLEGPVKRWRGVIKYNLTLLRCFLFPPLLYQSFVYLLFLFCFLFFSLFLFSDIFATDIWSSSSSVSKEVSLLFEDEIHIPCIQGLRDVPQLCKSLQQYLLASSKPVSTVNCAVYDFKWLHYLESVSVRQQSLHRDSSKLDEGAFRLGCAPATAPKGASLGTTS